MKRFLTLTAGIALGCAGAAPAPVLMFGPTEAPVRYAVNDNTDIIIAPPNGGEFRTHAVNESTIEFAFGETTPEGRRVTATYVAFHSSTEGAGGNSSHTGEAFAGQPFHGLLSADGNLKVVDGPEIPSDILAEFDPAAFLTGMLPPLPPEGRETEAPWPHHLKVTDRTIMAPTSVYDGMARFAGDSTWNGIRARVIVSEGKAEVTGSGTPPGAPGQVDMTLDADVRSVYLWDPARGVLLAARSEFSGGGLMDMSGFTMPITYEGSTEITLNR